MSPAILNNILHKELSLITSVMEIALKCEAETVCHLGLKVWSLAPQETRQLVSIRDFKPKI